MKYYSKINPPMITYVFLVSCATCITFSDQKISLGLRVEDVSSLDILLERNNGGFINSKLGTFL